MKLQEISEISTLQWIAPKRNLAVIEGLLILILSLAAFFRPADARPPALFTPPSLITVTMYELEYPRGRNTGRLCTVTPPSVNWGCTEFNEGRYPPSQQRPYPYSSNPVTIPIETDYLLDVVPWEIGPYYHPVALQAQAIAARSFAYWHIHNGSTINNSNQFQVFVPYKFESLPPVTDPNNTTDPCASSNLNSDQQLICNAVAPRHYVSYPPEDDLPAFTEFTGDVFQRTVNGSH